MYVDEVVIERAARGEADAEPEIFETFYPRVYPLARRIVGETDSDDVSHDAFTQLLLKLDSFAATLHLQRGCVGSRSIRLCSTFVRAIGIQPSHFTRLR